MNGMLQTSTTLEDVQTESTQKKDSVGPRGMYRKQNGQCDSGAQSFNGNPKPSIADSGQTLGMDDTELYVSQEELETLLDLAEFLMESVHRLVEEGALSKSQFPALYS